MLLHNSKVRFNSCNSVKQHSVTHLFSYSPIHLFTSKRKAVAFTLAEVLITLGIIGVVAAITMPSLIQKYQEHVTVKKVQKFYSLISQAGEFNRTNDVVCEPLAPWNSSGAQTVYEYFKPFLKISKDCGTDGTGCSYTKNYHHINGQVSVNYGTSSSYYKVVLAVGSAVMFRGGADGGLFGEVFYDINGEREPNVWGKDMFSFLIKPNNCVLVPYGINIDPNISKPTGWNLTAWVVHFGNMDYLHCKGLFWNGAKSCKDK